MRPGEALHRAGDDGARRARRYLESTTRVKTVWLNTDPYQAGRLTFKWPHDPGTYSFDLGGVFHEGDLDRQHFAAESKAYTNNQNHQATEFRTFLAGCYCVDLAQPMLYQHYMWLTSHPFSVDDWSRLCRPDWIIKSLLQERARALGAQDEAAARSKINMDLVEALSKKLWLTLIPDRHEELSITKSNRALIMSRAVEEETL
ncbi:hypothetical protein GCM10009836_61520 [Pseudonocardia ailaonensis]|uniref:Uncharacterized protein n=1 Tax=Pseudonocardia ailaonensis TaxID=367279 RepID=A0ABN2NNX6_9PSEU